MYRSFIIKDSTLYLSNLALTATFEYLKTPSRYDCDCGLISFIGKEHEGHYQIYGNLGGEKALPYITKYLNGIVEYDVIDSSVYSKKIDDVQRLNIFTEE